MRRTQLLFLLLLLPVVGCGGGGTPSALQLVSIELLTRDGGRVDWSPDGAWIAFDRKGADGFFDVWRMRPDASDQECLTCDHLDLPNRHIGQPAWHPSGEWLVMQVEKAVRQGMHDIQPGAGQYHDLWLLNVATGAVHRLTDVDNGLAGASSGGSLHPVFSHDGERLFWTDMQDYNLFQSVIGDWQLSIAEVELLPAPHLVNRVNYEPGASGLWFESHGWGPDDSWIYFSGNTEGQPVLASDIARMDLDAAPAYRRLTHTAGLGSGEPGHYDEHAHYTPDFDAFAWLNDESGISELWLANADGSGRRRVTGFNTPGTEEYDYVEGLRSVPSDNAWNPRPPAGREQLALYVQVDFDLLSNQSTRNEIYLLEFVWGP